MADVFTSEVRLLPTGLPRGHPEAYAFTVSVRYRGTYPDRRQSGGQEQDWYSIDHNSASLSRAGFWKFCPQRFQQWQYRHTFAEAMTMAAAHVDAVRVNGRTWLERQALVHASAQAGHS